MAITFPKAHLRVHKPEDAYLGFVARYLPEGASQTFVAGSPLVFSSGLLIESTSPINTTNQVACFALEAGHNTTGRTVKVLPVLPGLVIWGTLLAAAAADYVLAATDVGTVWLLAKTANFPTTGANGWYVQHVATNAAAKITHLGPHDLTPPNVTQTTSAVGDTNARVGVEIMPTANAWFL